MRKLTILAQLHGLLFRRHPTTDRELDCKPATQGLSPVSSSNMTLITEPTGKGRTPNPRRRAASETDKVKPEDTAEQLTSFAFFALPRELRDEIYLHCLTFKRKFRSQHGARLRGRRVTETSLLQVSKQFRSEYLERAEQHMTFVIVDRPEFHGDPLKLPPAISRARYLELYLAIACDSPDHFTDQCRVVKEVRMHRKWIADLCDKMRFLESLSITLVVDPHQHVKECETKLLELQHKLTNINDLKALEVCHCDYAGKDVGWSFANKRTVVMEWSAEDGTLRRDQEARRMMRPNRTDERQMCSRPEGMGHRRAVQTVTLTKAEARAAGRSQLMCYDLAAT